MKQAVHKLVKEWDQRLHLSGDHYWKIDGITDPQAFFSHLPKIFPHGMTLLFEGLEIGASAKAFYEEFPALYRKNVACDGIDPVPDSHHVAFGPTFTERLCQLIASQGMAAAFYHFKGYSEQEIVFTFHDAFEDELVISTSVPESAVQEFANALGQVAILTPFSINLRDQLGRMDRALNPPWWRRVLKYLKPNP